MRVRRVDAVTRPIAPQLNCIRSLRHGLYPCFVTVKDSPPRTAALAHALRGSKFLIVGGLVFFFDAAMYNILVFWSPTHGWGEGLMHGQPILAKVLTIAAASCLTYLGNRFWTYGDRDKPHTARSIFAFVVVNMIASALQLGCLGFSRYVLGLDSAFADNVSGTFIGQVVSTTFRYFTYGKFVFPEAEGSDAT